MPKRSQRLTTQHLKAMAEALAFRLAGYIDDHDDYPRQDYESAMSWVQNEIESRNGWQYDEDTGKYRHRRKTA